jgi:hypothetical protein
VRALVSTFVLSRVLTLLFLATSTGTLACAPASGAVPVVTAVVEVPKPLPGVDPLSPEERLLALLTLDNPRIEQVAFSLAHLEDTAVREDAAWRLVALARTVLSPAWRPEGAPEMTGPALERARTKALAPVFAAMADIGGRPVVDLAFAEAADYGEPRERRLQALRALDRAVPSDDVSAIERRERIKASIPSPVRPTDTVGYLRKAARACFSRALSRDPAFPPQQARIRLRFSEDGVVAATVEGDLDEDLRRCLQDAAGRLRADEGQGLPAEMVVPFSFLRS